MHDKYLTEAQVCERLQVSRSTLWHLRLHRGLPHVRIGSAIRYRLEEVDEWLQQQSNSNRTGNDGEPEGDHPCTN